MKTLFVVWKDPDTTMWHPVAKLTRESGGKYYFNYTAGAKNKNFSAFPRMSDLSETYVSSELFSFFKNRLISPNRPEYFRLLDWSNMSQSSYDELDILGIYGGERKTDSYRIVSAPSKDAQGYYRILFFVSGIRYLEQSIQIFIESLREGQKLRFKFEDCNQFDSNAVLVYPEYSESVTLGYCPRYYNCDIRMLLSNPNLSDYSLTVVKNNYDAPPQYRLLCEFSVQWPEGFSALVSDEYKNFKSYDDL